ncbi:hypothetical protein FOXB_15367 [Fusarium oxysporum f. sp. conglutinans Fo5176]|uniref:Uncharacterized protein n=1 Tax=Fusarium oxysporum (strain Fo5176) TaxID=660025 RepID=F9G9N5_FUSOF|nr:hypothetical protein FOXB_15367 [Fusarium oxysporum f. sp. conglutinans Fo5176]
MDAKKDSRPSQAQKAQRPTKLVLGLRALVLGVTIAGIVVSSIPAPKNFIAIGILGPAFVTTFCWSLIELVYPLVRIFPPAYISFRIFIDSFIVIGSVICLICFGLFRDWWPGGSALSSSEAPLAREILFQAALGLACASTLHLIKPREPYGQGQVPRCPTFLSNLADAVAGLANTVPVHIDARPVLSYEAELGISRAKLKIHEASRGPFCYAESFDKFAPIRSSTRANFQALLRIIGKMNYKTIIKVNSNIPITINFSTILGFKICTGKPLAFIELQKVYFELLQAYDFQLTEPLSLMHSESYAPFRDFKLQSIALCLPTYETIIERFGVPNKDEMHIVWSEEMLGQLKTYASPVTVNEMLIG